MRGAAWGMVLLAGGCMTAGDEAPRVGDGRFECNANALGGLVGRAASRELGTEAMRAANARTIRWIQPGQAVTMDYRPDRLNIALDAQNRVERLTCG